MRLFNVLDTLRYKARAKFSDIEQQEKVVYDILSALRGPDTEDSSNEKHVTTARLRYVIGLTEAPRALTVNANRASAEKVEEALSESSTHFAENFKRAAGAVKTLFNVDLLNDTISVPVFAVGKKYIVKSKKHPLGRPSVVAVVSTDPDQYNLISEVDYRPWFAESFDSVDDLHAAVSEAKFIIGITAR